MTSAHLYHDCLRRGDKRPDFALLLVPRGGGASWLEEPDFQRLERVGVAVFEPDATQIVLDQVLNWADGPEE